MRSGEVARECIRVKGRLFKNFANDIPEVLIHRIKLPHHFYHGLALFLHISEAALRLIIIIISDGSSFLLAEVGDSIRA